MQISKLLNIGLIFLTLTIEGVPPPPPTAQALDVTNSPCHCFFLSHVDVGGRQNGGIGQTPKPNLFSPIGWLTRFFGG